MGPLTAAAAGKFLKDNWKVFAIVGALALCLFLAWCVGGLGEKNDQLKEVVETQREVRKADEGAAGQRVDDAKTLEKQKQEIRDAVENAQGSDDKRRAGGCAILRQQKRPLPPACR